ncbi:hypothetical protein AB4Z38_11420 [Arthrobacter sp. 2RAF6]|uniref:hypothetical protein n=1 Tax=Arthrobacter sp. 2RAF6 TaxID=3233002 RepID=UPI003F91D854
MKRRGCLQRKPILLLLIGTVLTSCASVQGREPRTATPTPRETVTAKLGIGAMGCSSDAGSQQQWFVDFVMRPIEMSFSQGTLNWKSGTDTLIFKGK